MTLNDAAPKKKGARGDYLVLKATMPPATKAWLQRDEPFDQQSPWSQKLHELLERGAANGMGWTRLF